MRLGIDFGTTNSSVARFDGDKLYRLGLDPANDNPHVLPSLIYIDRRHQAIVGTQAAAEYLEHETGRAANWEQRRVGEIDVVAADMSYVQTVHVLVDTAARGRLLQYVKTALRDPTYEGTQVFDRFYTVDELIALILRALKAKAERAFEAECNEVVLGRPVRFSDNPAVTERAEELLYKAARWAGFQEIRFELEPVGATYYYHRSASHRQTAFIFDFGGGTLDLTVAEVGGNLAPHILATHGVLVGGDDLDRRLMQSLRRYFGTGVPSYLLDLLDNWQTMPILSRPSYLRVLDELRKTCADPDGIAALRTLVTRNLGFGLFRTIEQAKKRLSDEPATQLDFEHENIAIHEIFTRAQFEAMIRREIEQVEEGVRAALTQAGLQPSAIEVVLRTGGTSAVPIFAALLAHIFGEEKLAQMDLLTSVVGGLAIVAHEQGGTPSRCAARYPRRGDPFVANLRVQSGRPYELYSLRVGAKCYLDSAYTLKRTPVELSGLPTLRTAQQDKSNSSHAFLQFDLARAARVYIAYDASARVIPRWLRVFTPQPIPLAVEQWGTERTMQLFAKDFPAGRVVLGGNRGEEQRGELFLNYFVVLQSHLTTHHFFRGVGAAAPSQCC